MTKVYSCSFWETDFVSHTGFETISNHLKEGQKSCKWLEDFLKQRAKAEEDYAKSLLKIAKNTTTDFGSLRSTLEKLLSESEVEASLHLTVAAKLQEQCAKLTEFRESQKEERKKIEDAAHRFQRAKTDQYKKMSSCKSTYESRHKVAEKAEADVEKLKFGSKAKEVEKAKSRAIQCRSSCLKADEDYKASVFSLEAARLNWEHEHVICCDEMQQLEENRICTMRNLVWIFTNMVSDLCCHLDDSREQIRQVAENCSEVEDIYEFTKQKTTGKMALKTICYYGCGANGAVINPSSTNKTDNVNSNLPSISNGLSDHIYEMGRETDVVYTALYAYTPQNPDEIELREGDRVQRISFEDGGWIKGLNLQSNLTGLVPLNYVATND